MGPQHRNAIEDLIRILQLAYSGERAAAYAYRGHWHSVRHLEVRTRIREIEEEEWHHRRLVGDMLKTLGSAPDSIREVRAYIVGQILRVLCHVCGKLLPLYAAGKLESKNIREYETAARYALEAGHPDFIDCLLTMAEVEWEHEKFFRECVRKSRWGSRLQLWPIPPPKETIRSSFEEEALNTSSLALH